MRTLSRLPVEITRRGLAAVMAVVYAMGMLSGLFHMVEVKHEVCADHGELVHAGELGASDAHAADSDVATLSSHESEAHGHCGLDHHVDSSADLDVPQPLGAPTLLAGPLGPSLSAHDALVVRNVLDEAPKQGPPVA